MSFHLSTPDETAGLTLVDRLLADQQRLTAVERFSQWHARSAQSGHPAAYSRLMPAAPPGPGEQYRFEVNLDACTGCKACVSACHSLNGLDEDEAWRDTGTLIGGGRRGQGWQQTVTSACHHCADPACASGCPVAAYEKEADTGIVRHLDDQCIGCQYCILKCPYDVPKYSPKLGIVRKCDLCAGRLRQGEPPACAQACPTGAITIRVVSTAGLAAAPGTRMVPGAFDSSCTRPATLYHTRRPIPADARPAAHGSLPLEHAHWPLVWMLTLTQAAAGLFTVLAFLALAGKPVSVPAVCAAFTALGTGLGISLLHLGRPLGAWRFFLGLRTSWMSREILAFQIFAGAAAFSCLTAFRCPELLPGALTAAAITGLLSIFTSVMIYADTRRPYWNAGFTALRFYGTVAVLGLGGGAAAAGSSALTACSLIAGLGLHGGLLQRHRRAWEEETHPWHLSALVIRRKLRRPADAGDVLAILAFLSGFCLLLTTGTAAAVWGSLFLLTLFAGQVLDRFLFFTAAMAPRMTGGPPP